MRAVAYIFWFSRPVPVSTLRYNSTHLADLLLAHIPDYPLTLTSLPALASGVIMSSFAQQPLARSELRTVTGDAAFSTALSAQPAPYRGVANETHMAAMSCSSQGGRHPVNLMLRARGVWARALTKGLVLVGSYILSSSILLVPITPSPSNPSKALLWALHNNNILR